MSDTHNRTYKRRSLDIESKLLNKISLIGTERVGEMIGIHRSQISRWKTTRIPQIAKLLAILEWDILDEDIARIAMKVGEMLIQKNAHVLRTHERLSTHSFKPSDDYNPIQHELFEASEESDTESREQKQ